MQNRLEVRLKPSSRLKTLYCAALLALAIICIAAPVGWPVRATALIYLGVVGRSIYRSWVQLTGARSVIAIRYDDSDWWLETIGEGWHQVRLCDSASVMTARVIALEFSTMESHIFQRRTFHTVILEDSALAAQRRQLRLSLRASSVS